MDSDLATSRSGFGNRAPKQAPDGSEFFHSSLERTGEAGGDCSPGGILVHSKLVLGIGPARAASVQPRSKSDIQATDPHGGAALAMAALLVGGLLNQRGGVLMIGVRGALSPPHHAWLRSPPTSTS